MIREIDSIRDYILKCNLIPVGIGTTAVCFKLDNKLLKIYLNTNNKDHLFLSKYNIIDHLSKISGISNDSYLGPETILVKDNNCVGYIYDFVSGPTLYNVSNNTAIAGIFSNYDKLLNDTRKISDAGFHIIDLHEKNIIYSNGVKIIDLDRGYFEEIGDSFEWNMLKINYILLNSILNIKEHEIIKFKDKTFDELYNLSIYKNYKNIYDLLEIFDNFNIISKGDAKKYKRKNSRSSYNAYYKY